MPSTTAPAVDPDIEPVTADDRAAMDGWLALQVRCHAHDTPELPPPCPLSHAHRFSWPGLTHVAWIVREGDEVVAAAHLNLPQQDNLHHGFAAVLVAPGHRRRGLGTRLLAHLTAQAGEAGRRHLALGAGAHPDRPNPGSAFLHAMGARLAMAEKRRRLVLPPADPERLCDLAEAVRRASPGHRLVHWVGPTPAEWLDDVARLLVQMSTDAPTGDLAFTPERWTADRVAETDAAAAANGVRAVVTAAAAPDGHLVAFTEASTCVVADGFAQQGNTLVTREHRGRRLGLRVKLANLELLVRAHPEVRAIDTFNADENRWMLAVNEAMGFVAIHHVEDWELDVRPARVPGADQAGTIGAISDTASGP